MKPEDTTKLDREAMGKVPEAVAAIKRLPEVLAQLRAVREHLLNGIRQSGHGSLRGMDLDDLLKAMDVSIESTRRKTEAALLETAPLNPKLFYEWCDAIVAAVTAPSPGPEVKTPSTMRVLDYLSGCHAWTAPETLIVRHVGASSPDVLHMAALSGLVTRAQDSLYADQRLWSATNVVEKMWKEWEADQRARA